MERLQPLPEPSELSLNQLFVIAQQLFQALSTLHDQEHIVHGDIKLQNLMITHDEQGKFTTPYHNSCGDSVEVSMTDTTTTTTTPTTTSLSSTSFSSSSVPSLPSIAPLARQLCSVIEQMTYHYAMARPTAKQLLQRLNAIKTVTEPVPKQAKQKKTSVRRTFNKGAIQRSDDSPTSTVMSSRANKKKSSTKSNTHN
jgi:serine/threonine protein kinase